MCHFDTTKILTVSIEQLIECKLNGQLRSSLSLVGCVRNANKAIFDRLLNGSFLRARVHSGQIETMWSSRNLHYIFKYAAVD